MGLGKTEHIFFRGLVVICASVVFIIFAYEITQPQDISRQTPVKSLIKNDQAREQIRETKSRYFKKYEPLFTPRRSGWAALAIRGEERKTPEEARSQLQIETPQIEKDRRIKALIIVAGYRTGSSFVGDFFNQHPDVFYLFEPLFYDIFKNDKTIHATVLRDLLMCNMTSLQEQNYDAWLKATENFMNLRTYRSRKLLKETAVCLKQKLCFRFKSRAACTPDLCSNASATTCHSCLPPSVGALEESCRNAKFRVIKVIRLADLDTLRSVWQHPNIDLKIIHLVRDPRSTAISRIGITKSPDYARTVRGTCARNKQNHEYFINNSPGFEWLQESYKLLRYEDAISDPFGTVEKLYKFVNFYLPESILTWLKKSTTATDHYRYGTSRDSEKQMYKWRSSISFDNAIAVQEECSRTMAMFGYIPAVSPKQLRNISLPLLEHNF